MPKIVVHRGTGGEELSITRGEGLMAVVRDVPPPIELPFFSWDGPIRLVDFLEKRFLKGKTGQEEVQFGVDGRRVPPNPFLQELFHSLLRAMVSLLKRIKRMGTFRRLSLRLDHPEGGTTSRP